MRDVSYKKECHNSWEHSLQLVLMVDNMKQDILTSWIKEAFLYFDLFEKRDVKLKINLCLH